MKSEFLLAAVTVLLIGASSYSQDVIRGTERRPKIPHMLRNRPSRRRPRKRKKWLMRPSPEPRQLQKLLPTPPEKPLTRLCRCKGSRS